MGAQVIAVHRSGSHSFSKFAEEAIVLDPGLGFAKTAEHDWKLLQNLEVFVGLGFPVLVGASRKRFLGRLLEGLDGTPRPPLGRDVATAVVSALAAALERFR